MQKHFMQKAIEFAINGVEKNQGGPFGAIIIKNNEIVGIGNNQVTSTNDPTAHAEVTAIRDACKNLNTFSLEGCEIYTSCEPCPMCLGAIYWSRIEKIYFGSNKKDAAAIGFDDAFFYEELKKSFPERKIPMVEFMRTEALLAFKKWEEKENKIEY